MLGAHVGVPTVLEHGLIMAVTKRVVQSLASACRLARISNMCCPTSNTFVCSGAWRGDDTILLSSSGASQERDAKVFRERSESVWESGETVEGGKLAEVVSKFYHSRSS